MMNTESFPHVPSDLHPVDLMHEDLVDILSGEGLYSQFTPDQIDAVMRFGIMVRETCFRSIKNHQISTR